MSNRVERDALELDGPVDLKRAPQYHRDFLHAHPDHWAERLRGPRPHRFDGYLLPATAAPILHQALAGCLRYGRESGSES